MGKMDPTVQTCPSKGSLSRSETLSRLQDTLTMAHGQWQSSSLYRSGSHYPFPMQNCPITLIPPLTLDTHATEPSKKTALSLTTRTNCSLKVPGGMRMAKHTCWVHILLFHLSPSSWHRQVDRVAVPNLPLHEIQVTPVDLSTHWLYAQEWIVDEW